MNRKKPQRENENRTKICCTRGRHPATRPAGRLGRMHSLSALSHPVITAVFGCPPCSGIDPWLAALEADALPQGQRGYPYWRLLFVGCLTSQQHASVSLGRICTDNFTCCHTEIEVADQTFHLTQSQYTDTGPTSPSADPIMPGAWQGSQ